MEYITLHRILLEVVRPNVQWYFILPMEIESTSNVFIIVRGISTGIMIQSSVFMSVQMEPLLIIQPGIVLKDVHGDHTDKQSTKRVFSTVLLITLRTGDSVFNNVVSGDFSQIIPHGCVLKSVHPNLITIEMISPKHVSLNVLMLINLLIPSTEGVCKQ